MITATKEITMIMRILDFWVGVLCRFLDACVEEERGEIPRPMKSERLNVEDSRSPSVRVNDAIYFGGSGCG